MIIRKEIDIHAPLTDSQRKMLETIKDRPIEFDEDCPALTKEQLTQKESIGRTPRRTLQADGIDTALSSSSSHRKIARKGLYVDFKQNIRECLERYRYHSE